MQQQLFDLHSKNNEERNSNNHMLPDEIDYFVSTWPLSSHLMTWNINCSMNKTSKTKRMVYIKFIINIYFSIFCFKNIY